MKQSDEETLMMQYLLGELSEEDQLKLEERFFADDEIHEQLVAMEDELRYDYARGGLTPRQREQFEKRFLSTPADRQRVDLAKGILEQAARTASERAPAPEPKRSLWQAFTEFFTVQPATRFAFASMAALVAMAGCTWLLVERIRLNSELEAKAKQANDQLLAQGRELSQERLRRQELERQLAGGGVDANSVAFALSPGLARGTEQSKRLVVPRAAVSVRFQLDVKKKGDYQRYRASVENPDGEELWSQDVPNPGAGVQVILAVPARIFAAGDYLVHLKGVTAAGETEEAGDYPFTIVRR